jgi:acetyl esterase/lipase
MSVRLSCVVGALFASWLSLVLACSGSSSQADAPRELAEAPPDAPALEESGAAAAESGDAGSRTDAPAQADASTDGPESIDLVDACSVPRAPDGGVTLVTDLVYATMDGQPQALDVAFPATGGSHPLVVIIHGGGWVSGDKSSERGEQMLLAGQGYVAASLNYRLVDSACPEDGGVKPDGGPCHPNHFPAAIEDVRCAVRWLKSNAAKYSIDPTRVASTGGSAGGHLAALLATGADVPGLDGPCPLAGDPSVTAAVPFYGAEDLYDWDPSYKSGAVVAEFLGTPAYDSDPSLAKLASPIDHVSAQTPPFLLLHGTVDMTAPYSQSVNMRATLQAAGVPATLVSLPGVGHAFPQFSNQPAYQQSSCTALAFLKKYLRP